jgi:hypothetical protein
VRDAGGLSAGQEDGSILAQSVKNPMTLRIENKAKLIGQG